MAGEPAWRITPHGLVLAVRLTPRGGRDAIDGVETLADGRSVLAVRVRAAPTEGEANTALVALVAKALKLPKSRVAVAAGATSRVKQLAIDGEGSALAEALRQMSSR